MNMTFFYVHRIRNIGSMLLFSCSLVNFEIKFNIPQADLLCIIVKQNNVDVSHILAILYSQAIIGARS